MSIKEEIYQILESDMTYMDKVDEICYMFNQIKVDRDRAISELERARSDAYKAQQKSSAYLHRMNAEIEHSRNISEKNVQGIRKPTPNIFTGMLTQEYLKSIIDYNKETGEFRWRHDFACVKAGQIAGSTCKHKKGNPYHKLTINKKTYRAENLAWLYVYAVHPKHRVIHKDGNNLNNAFSNLCLGKAIKSGDEKNG